MPNPEPSVKPLELSESAESRLIDALEEQIGLAEDFRNDTDWDRLHESYWRAYFCQPDQDTKDFPWPGASNLFMPLTRVSIDVMVAQEYDAMLANDPLMEVTPIDYASTEDAEKLSLYWQWFYREQVPMRTFGADSLLEMCVDGTFAWKVRQNRDLVVRREEIIIEEPGEVDPVTGIPSPSNYRTEERAFIERNEQITNDLEDLERLYMAPDTGTSLQWPFCRWYYAKYFLTWDDLVERRRAGYKVDENFKAFLGERDVSEKEQLKRDREETSETAVEQTIEITEHYMRWPIKERYINRFDSSGDVDQGWDADEGYQEEVVVTYCQKARKILRVVPLARIYADGKRPHLMAQFKRVPRFPYGTGMASILRHINRASNSIMNQGIDYGTLANLPWGFYSPVALGEIPSLLGISPGTMIPSLDPRGVNFPRLQNDPNFWLSFNQQLQFQAEKAANVSEVQMGRNPTTPNAPRTAKGQAFQIAQGNIGFSCLVSQHAESFIELMKRNHELKRKYSAPEQRFRIRNAETKRLQDLTIRADTFQIPVEFSFILNPNRAAEANQYMQLFQLCASVPFIQQQPQAVRALLKQAYNKVGSCYKVPFDQIWPESFPPIIQGPQPPQAPAGGAGQGTSVPGPPAPPVPGQMPPEGVPPGMEMPMPGMPMGVTQ